MKISKKEQKKALDGGWEPEEAKRGYAFFSSEEHSCYGNEKLLHVEKLDEQDVFDSDYAAALQAKKDGFNIVFRTYEGIKTGFLVS